MSFQPSSQYCNRFVLIVLLFCLSIKIFAKSDNILILHSYNYGLKWTETIQEGISKEFNDSIYDHYELFTEYLDAKRFYKESNLLEYKTFLQSKYKDFSFDLILCSDNAAFSFLTNYKNELFGDVPVVFCGVNYCDSIPKNFTGIMETVDFETNLKTIISIHPNYHKIYIINDRSVTGSILTTQVKHVAQEKIPNLKYEFLSDYTLSQLQDKLTSLQPNDIVLLLLYTQDKDGNTYSMDYLPQRLQYYVNVPIYGTWGFYLGNGVVGGYLVDGKKQGENAAKIAKKILEGHDVNNIDVTNSSSQFFFDYNIMSKYGIKIKQLPDNSTIINSPYDLFYNNKAFFLALGIFLISLVFLLALLIIRKRQLKKLWVNETHLADQISSKSVELNNALIKAEESNKLKTKFLGNISHEIRTPLNAIVGFSELLIETRNDDDLFRCYANIIQDSSKQLVGIIDDLLTISLIESSQVLIKRTNISLNELLTDKIEHFAIRSKSNIIKQGTFPIKNKKDKIFTDLQKVAQVLDILLDNANKFTTKGIIEVGYKVEPDSRVEIYVKDSGIGIAAKNHKLIFEPFKQAAQDNLVVFGGIGLGLPIAKAFVELLEGEIRVESEIDKGTVFYFTLPMKKETSKVFEQTT